MKIGGNVLGALAALALALTAAPAAAKDRLKVGYINSLSGGTADLGRDMLDGFNLAVKLLDGKLGGLPTDVVVGDDQGKPEVGRQLADKMIESDRVDMVTGILNTTIMLAVDKPILDAGVFLISGNSAPVQLAGKGCHAHFFSASTQNETTAEVVGEYMQNAGYKHVYMMGSDWVAGHQVLGGFKRWYKGEVVKEVYTTFGQLDYAPEIAQLRAAKPDAVFFFYIGGMGINFINQFSQAGLKGQIPLFGPWSSFDDTILPGVGESAAGAKTAVFWSEQLDNPANKRFVAEFSKAYGRMPSGYAANSYDAAMMMDAAVRAVGGKIEDKAALQKAFEANKFDSVRGSTFRLNKNHMPILDWYASDIALDDKGHAYNKLGPVVSRQHEDAYAKDCEMK